MLFKKKTVSEKIEHLVKKNDVLADYVHGTKEEKLALAKALGANDNNSSVDLLLRLIDDNDEDVVFAACESLRKVGCEHNTADLLEKLNKIPKEDEKVREDCTGASSSFIIKTDFTFVIPVNISLKQIVERTTMSA